MEAMNHRDTLTFLALWKTRHGSSKVTASTLVAMAVQAKLFGDLIDRRDGLGAAVALARRILSPLNKNGAIWRVSSGCAHWYRLPALTENLPHVEP